MIHVFPFLNKDKNAWIPILTCTIVSSFTLIPTDAHYFVKVEFEQIILISLSFTFELVSPDTKRTDDELPPQMESVL